MICHAATAATRAGRFPKPGDPLDPAWQQRCGRTAIRLGPRHRCWTSPALRAMATAAALRLDATPEPLLDDLDPGLWAGSSLDDLAAADPPGLARWLEDPHAAAPGGEAPAALVDRVSRWLDAQANGPGVVAVTHAMVIRAAVIQALGAPMAALRQIDVAPLSLTRLSGQPGRWRLACLNRPLPRRSGNA